MEETAAKTVPVEIVRPKRTWEAIVGENAGIVLYGFTTAYLLMLLVPVFSSWHPGYWQSGAVYLAAWVLFPHRGPTLDAWSRKRPK